jgi:PAS domain S-box-containing protein
MLEPNSENTPLAQQNMAIAELQQKISQLEQENASLKSELQNRENQLEQTETNAIELEQINLELRQTLEQLVESEAKFRTLFEVSNEGIYSVEVNPPVSIHLPLEEQCEQLYRNIRVTKANPAFAAMYGVDNPDDLIGIGNADVHAPDSEKNKAFIRGTIGNNYRFHHLETEEVDRQGRLLHVLNSGIYTIKDGYIVGGWGTQVEITELKETQQALLETEQKRVAELAAANREISSREREKTLLLAISQTIATVRDKQDLLQLIIQQIKPLFNFYDCTVPLIRNGRYFCHLSDLMLSMDNPSAKQYLYEAGFNRKEGTILQHSSLQRVIDDIEATGQPVIIDYEQNWSNYHDAQLLQALQELGYKEGLAVLLKAGGEVLGCFIINSLEKSFFPPAQFSLFQAIADQVAVAIANIQANEEVLAHAKELQRIEKERTNELEKRVQERTAELEQLSAELEKRVQERTQELAQTIERLNEETTERRRLAGEIHDMLAQTFTGISVQLELAQFLMPQNLGEVETILERIGELTQTGLAEARRSVGMLRSTTEDAIDLLEQLSFSLERMTQGTSIHAEIAIAGTPYLLPPFMGQNLLRIGQEAITNVLRHAQASHLWIVLTYTPDDITLCIKDNGCGFSVSETTEGFGLISMSERVDRIHGRLSISSQPGEGTEIVVRSPNMLIQSGDAS